MRWEGRGQCEGERCSGDVGQQGATLVGDYPQGRECWMITRRVECLNGLFSVVSTSWQLLEHMEAEGATLGLLSVSVEEEKSRQVGGLRSCR